jgi:16S rRNA (guanine527-N7)-methyltransferase
MGFVPQPPTHDAAAAAAAAAAAQDEVAAARKALSKLQGRLVAVPRVQSWAPEGQRTAVVVAKTGPTPKDYPRPPGTPGKKPL